jgi:hypothetical protein
MKVLGERKQFTEGMTVEQVIEALKNADPYAEIFILDSDGEKINLDKITYQSEDASVVMHI